MLTTHKIVLTGGPCAGKSTAMKYLEIELNKRNFKAIPVKEAATEVLSSIDRTKLSVFEIQKMIFTKTLELEEEALKKAQFFSRMMEVVVLFDRGILDQKAYISHDEFKEMMELNGTSELESMKRYDSVIHLVSAADGAEQFYTNENNGTRLETRDEAVLLDKRTMEAWCGHEIVSVITNKGSFQQKMEETLEAMLSSIGYPKPIETEKKFLLQSGNMHDLIHDSPACLIEQTYLVNGVGHAERVRRVVKVGQASYFHTLKKKTNIPFSNEELEREISEQEFHTLLERKDESRHTVMKKRYYKFFDRDYFSIDVYVSPHPGMVILEREFGSVKNAKEFLLPESLTDNYKVIDVSEDKNYTNYSLAKK